MEKNVELLIDEASIVAGGTREAVKELKHVISVSVCVRIVYPAGTTAGIKVWILTAPDETTPVYDTQNDTDKFTSFQPSFVANSTKQKTINLDTLQRWIKIVVENLDGANAQGAIKVFLEYLIGES